MSMRIAGHPIITYEQRREVAFTFDGKELLGREGEPIAAALMAQGIHIFRHTHKRGEPRGLFCGIGQCSDCMVVLDGVSNVRACTTLLQPGMRVETQRGLGRSGCLK